MDTVGLGASSCTARWDGQMVLFDLRMGATAVPCAISSAALEQLAGRRCYRKEEALACFERERAAIEACATEKFLARSASLCGRLTLWADDMEAPEVAPRAASI